MAAQNLKERLEHAEKWVLSNPNPPHRWPLTWLYQMTRVSYALMRDVLAGNLTLHAMSLVYTTLLSVVPLLALSFSVLKALGVHERMEPFLYQFFQPLGPQGVEMANKILGFVDNMKVGVLGSVGLAMLVYTVVSLVQKIERSFNVIWRVPEMRSMGQRFSNYLSVILVGPLLMVSAIGVSATIFSSAIVKRLMEIEPFGSLLLTVSRLMPFMLVVCAFTFVYMFMPNTRVKLRCAVVGGVVAGISWQAGGLLFASFVAGSSKYAAIYSSFAIGIILLIWVYVNWMILLLGASITFYLQNPGSVAKRQEVRPSAELAEQAALVLMWLVCKPFSRGEPAPSQDELEYKLRVPVAFARGICEKLIRARLLSPAGDDGEMLVPGRSLELITIGTVLDAIRRDEDQLVERLPPVFPVTLQPPSGGYRDTTFSELLHTDAGTKGAVEDNSSR